MRRLGRQRPRGPALPAAGLVCLLFAGLPQAAALIDPKFTPVHLVRDSRAIVVGRVVRGEGAHEWAIEEATALKGAAPRRIALSLRQCDRSQVASIRKLLAGRAAPAALFVNGRSSKRQGCLSVGGTWLAVSGGQGEGGGWLVRSSATRMSGVWAGGTDMLIRLVRHVLAEAATAVPTAVGTSWMREPYRLGCLAGRITGMQAVRLANDRRTYLFVASAGGDRLYRAVAEDEAFEDVTAAARLTARSQAHAWVDLNADGRLDLLSWDGRLMLLYEASRQITFGRPVPVRAFRTDQGCLGLAPCSTASDGGAAVLVSTSGLPVLLHLGADGSWRAETLRTGPAVAAAGEARSACVVADLDNDGLRDVLQPRTKAGLLWRGSASGQGRPVRSRIACPDGRCRPGVADFNQDGFLDVFVSGPAANRLWENDGNGGFANVLGGTGSLNYKSLAGFSACRPADLNHDGRTDLCLLHEREAFTYHFNRGFRCFGEQGGLRLPGPTDPAGALPGQLACAAADFNDDGSLDLAVGFADGQVWCYYNAGFNKPLIRVGLAAGSGGPITVSLWQGVKRPLCVGALPLCAAAGKVDFTLARPADCTIRWRTAGKPAAEKRIRFSRKLLDEGLDVVLER